MPQRFLINGVFIAIIAHALIGVSLIWDKILLQRPATKSLANYVFWLGGMSVLGVLLIPFGFKLPSAGLAALAVGTGAIHLAAIWFYYSALKMGEASETLSVMGGFAPLATALIAIPLLSEPLEHGSELAFALMVGGGFVMFASERFNWTRVLPSVLLSAGLFGLTNVLQKIVFNATGFVTGYVLLTIGTFLGAMALLLRPVWRREIFEQSHDAPPRSKFWYFVNRFISGVGSFLIFFAISRTNPAVVAAIAGLRYTIIFVGAYLITNIRPDWLTEDFHRRVLIGKTIATALIVAGLVLIGLAGRDAGNSDSAVNATSGASESSRTAFSSSARESTEQFRRAALRYGRLRFQFCWRESDEREHGVDRTENPHGNRLGRRCRRHFRAASLQVEGTPRLCGFQWVVHRHNRILAVQENIRLGPLNAFRSD